MACSLWQANSRGPEWLRKAPGKGSAPQGPPAPGSAFFNDALLRHPPKPPPQPRLSPGSQSLGECQIMGGGMSLPRFPTLPGMQEKNSQAGGRLLHPPHPQERQARVGQKAGSGGGMVSEGVSHGDFPSLPSRQPSCKHSGAWVQG